MEKLRLQLKEKRPNTMRFFRVQMADFDSTQKLVDYHRYGLNGTEFAPARPLEKRETMQEERQVSIFVEYSHVEPESDTTAPNQTIRGAYAISTQANPVVESQREEMDCL